MHIDISILEFNRIYKRKKFGQGMVKKEHPEWKQQYTAVDGIEYDNRKEVEEFRRKFPGDIAGPSLRIKKAIRSDVEEILLKNDEDFTKWFSERKITAQKLLKDYELLGTIPFLVYGFEDQKYDLTASTHLNNSIAILKDAIEYLDRIKQVRDENKE
jgi:hypothetical protein